MDWASIALAWDSLLPPNGMPLRSFDGWYMGWRAIGSMDAAAMGGCLESIRKSYPEVFMPPIPVIKSPHCGMALRGAAWHGTGIGGIWHVVCGMGYGAP